jgi:hypothetical protein
LHGDYDFRAQKENHFQGGFPSAQRKENYGARCDRSYKDQPKSREKTERERGAAALHVKARFDFGFE